MKKILFCALNVLVGFYSTAVLAQSQVAMYGIIDTGFLYVNHVNAAGDSVIKMPSLTGSLPSRIGFKGTEDLGGGIQALFVLENGYAPDNGSLQQGNRLFGRQSYIGLKNSYGTIKLGRQYNMTFFASTKADIMGPNIFGNGSLDPYIPNSRSDNAIGYLGTYSNVTLGATYSFGRDASSAGGPAATGCAGEVPGDSKACRQITGLMAYDTTSFGIATAYDIMYGGHNVVFGGLTNSNYNDQRISLNGYVIFGQTKIAAGLIDRETKAIAKIRSDLYHFGISHQFDNYFVLDAQVARLNVKDTTKVSTLSVARVTYNMSKRTAVYTSLGYMRNSGLAAVALDAGGTVGAGLDQAGVMIGIRHTF